MSVDPTKPKRPARTAKEKAFVKEFIKNGGNATSAALKVYDTTCLGSAKRIGYENTTKLNVVELMDTIVGLTVLDRLKCLSDGLYSTKVVSAVGDANGRSVENVEVPDYANRHKYLELSFKLDGSLNKSEDGGQTINFLQFIANQKNSYDDSGSN